MRRKQVARCSSGTFHICSFCSDHWTRYLPGYITVCENCFERLRSCKKWWEPLDEESFWLHDVDRYHWRCSPEGARQIDSSTGSDCFLKLIVQPSGGRRVKKLYRSPRQLNRQRKQKVLATRGARISAPPPSAVMSPNEAATSPANVSSFHQSWLSLSKCLQYWN